MIRVDSYDLQKTFGIPFMKIGGLLLLIFVISSCFAQQIPNRPVPPQLVNDFTNTLTPSQKHYLEQKLRNYNDTTSTQIAVVFVNDLQGTTAADFAYQLGEKWGVGTKDNNGIVILIKPKTNTKGEAFISVGYGLEPYITDALAKRIIENEMIPAFKNNDYYSGVNEATDIIIGLASGSFSSEKHSSSDDDTFILIFFIIMMVVMITFIKFAGKVGTTYSSKHSNSSIWNMLFWASLFSNNGRHNHHNHWNNFSGRSGGFGGFGGGSFGGGGAGGSW